MPSDRPILTRGSKNARRRAGGSTGASVVARRRRLRWWVAVATGGLGLVVAPELVAQDAVAGDAVTRDVIAQSPAQSPIVQPSEPSSPSDRTFHSAQWRTAVPPTRMASNRSSSKTTEAPSAARATASDEPKQSPESSPAIQLDKPQPIAPEAADAPDAQVAKMPWLLRKLAGDQTQPSVKMDPPRPPVDRADPPSADRLAPPSIGRTAAPAPAPIRSDDGWVSVTRPPLRDPSSKPSTLAPRQAPPRQAPQRERASTPAIAPESVRTETPSVETPPMEVSAPETNRQSRTESVATPDREIAVAEKVELKGAPEKLSKSKPTQVARRTMERRDVRDLRAEVEPSTRRRAPQPLPRRAESTSPRRLSADRPAARGRISDLPNVARDAVSVAKSSPRLDYTGRPAEPPRLTRSSARMQSTLRSVLGYFHRRPENATGRSNWGMMHAMMVYGVDTRVVAGRNNHSTIAWIAGNNACRGQRLFEIDADGIAIKSGPGLQGHQGQFLAVMSLCGVPKDYPIYVDGQAFSINEIVQREMRDCVSGNELTFTLIGLSHYLDTDQTWTAADGQTWSIERLIREELTQPVVGAACGGTHRLMAFAHALRRRRIEGKPIDGQWARAQKFTDDFVRYVYRLQNRDGSMSTDWFEGREDNGDRDRKIQTTGHMVEWLLTVTPDASIQNPKLVAAVNYLARTISEDPKHDWSIGPKGHALRSLAMYYQRVYQVGPAWQTTQVAAGRRTAR